MKTKKMKLVLNKRTVSNLENKNMKDLLGGAYTTQCDTIAECVTWGAGSCPTACYTDIPFGDCKGGPWYTECDC